MTTIIPARSITIMNALMPSPGELRQQLAGAIEWLKEQPTEYDKARYNAVRDLLRYALGEGPSPMLSLAGVPDAQDLHKEAVAAHTAEQEAIARGDLDGAVYPGCVAEAADYARGLGEPPVDD